MRAPGISCEQVQMLLVEKRELTAEEHAHTASCPDCGFFAMLSRSRAAGAAPAAAAASLAAPTLAGLEVRERLGGGAFGTVFKAWQPSLQRFVAVKWIPLARGAGDTDLARIRAEGIALGQLRHPHVLGVFDSGLAAGESAYWLVTELAEGSLRARAASIPKDPVRLARFFQQVLLGLEAAHAAGILHCDVKPENILLQTVDGVPLPKLADFGLARVFSQQDRAAGGGLHGTPDYAAPELWCGAAPSVQSDLWAAGVVFFELLAGAHPFPSKDVHSLRRRVETEPLPPVPGPSKALAALVASLLEKDPSRRPKSAREVSDAIDEILARRQRRVFRVAVASVTLVVVLVVGFIVQLDHSRRVSQAQLGRILQLADVKRLGDLRAEAEALWPARETNVAKIDDWLRRAGELRARIPLHQESLAQGAWDETAESRWQHGTLETLVADLRTFAAPEDASLGLTDGETIAAIERRAAFAREVRARSIDEHAKEWTDAAARVATDPRFAGFTLAPQTGLVPIGPDPRSSLEEFADVQTGSLPVRGAGGAFTVAEDTALVFVLLPAGRFRMGANGRENEGPVHEVTIPKPFFLSKYEMTQGQWRRFTRNDPSQYSAGKSYLDSAIDLRHPVESVSRIDAERALSRLGFALPTEEQWEYAARSGTTTRWWSGDDPSALGAIANVADRHAEAHGGVPGRPLGQPEPIDDGWTCHAPVGTYRASPWGLHEMAGNVWEWTRDAWRPRYDRPADPAQFAIRGGGWRGYLKETASAYRDPAAPGAKLTGLGVRPMRDVE